MGTYGKYCRVVGCDKQHKQHFCKLCEERNTTHFRSECPKGKRLYHGTHIRAVKPIATEGLNTTRGQLGEGIYFVETYEEAKSISYFRQKINKDIQPVSCVPTVVIECQVYLGRHTDLDGPSRNGTWHLEYASASNIHLPWGGIDYDFKEYCLKNKDRCLVTAIHLNDIRIGRFPNTRWPNDGFSAIFQLGPDATIDQIKNALRRIGVPYQRTPASPKAKLKKKKTRPRSSSPKRNNVAVAKGIIPSNNQNVNLTFSSSPNRSDHGHHYPISTTMMPTVHPSREFKINIEDSSDRYEQTSCSEVQNCLKILFLLFLFYLFFL